jgi:hypothetical protein
MPDVLADDPKSKAASGDERSPLPPVFTPNSVSPMANRLERCMRRVSGASEGARTGARGRLRLSGAAVTKPLEIRSALCCRATLTRNRRCSRGESRNALSPPVRVGASGSGSPTRLQGGHPGGRDAPKASGGATAPVRVGPAGAPWRGTEHDRSDACHRSALRNIGSFALRIHSNAKRADSRALSTCRRRDDAKENKTAHAPPCGGALPVPLGLSCRCGGPRRARSSACRPRSRPGSRR